MTNSYQQSQQKAKMAQTMGPGSNLTMAHKMKISMKGVNNNLPGANSSVRSSQGGGNQSSRPGTSHRVMGPSSYNTVGGSKYKNAVNKATTSLGHVSGSPNRISNNKKKNLMD